MIDVLQESDAAGLGDVIRIYRAAIPPSGQKPPEAIAAALRRKDYRILVTRGANRAIAGFAMVFVPPGEAFALLEYLAVDAPARGAGLGAGMVRAAEPDRMLLVEVDSIEGEGDERTTRMRRQAFYRRLGCQRVEGLRYLLPLSGEPKPMDLFVRPAGTAAPPLDKRMLREWLSIVYRDGYAQAPDDPRIKVMLSPVSDPPVLR
jgi:hypothetical protein